MEKKLGGERLGSGNKMKVDLHGYERSTHDMSYVWRNTMSAGTIVPFLCEVMTPGDDFEIHLEMDGKTHPTVGPLFGSYKVEAHIFKAAWRNYIGDMTINSLGKGREMNTVKIPQMNLAAKKGEEFDMNDPDNAQISSSALLKYLGISGVGNAGPGEGLVVRQKNGLPLLMYWDIIKNYYINKQEDEAWMIWSPNAELVETIDDIIIGTGSLPQAVTGYEAVEVQYTGAVPVRAQIWFTTSDGDKQYDDVVQYTNDDGSALYGVWRYAVTGDITVTGWFLKASEANEPVPHSFSTTWFDTMRTEIMRHTGDAGAFVINEHMGTNSPYARILNWGPSELTPYKGTQQGLALKTYNSDMFNNWLSTEWIDGPGGINELTRVDTSAGYFELDALALSKKVWQVMNRIVVAGGSMNDYFEVTYDHRRYTEQQIPLYQGGLMRELVFQEVISNSASDSQGDQPLGTLAGRGVMAQHQKGGHVYVEADEPCYVMGLVSITPRIDYSQGNKWDSELKTVADLHIPGMDQIGFQESINEERAWWDANWNGTTWEVTSAGKVPAWLNYMTNVNVVRGNFAERYNEMFMTLNRRYEMAIEDDKTTIEDLTTYIDPRKFNHIFAQTSLDAMNFWVQMGVRITARRKMSAKVMPNL